MNQIFICEKKNNYKGNLHSHSTRSDGKHSPEEVVDLYREKGYDFICLSDHEIYYRGDHMDSDDFICLDGIERAVSKIPGGVNYHVHGLYDHSLGYKGWDHDEKLERPQFTGDTEVVQEMIGELRDKGNLVIFNHPRWSRNTYDKVEKLRGFNHLEIYNHQSEVGRCAGYGIDFWDYLLDRGHKIYGVATDDVHRFKGDASGGEAFGGYIVCNTEKELSQETVIDCIRQGSYYSSQGPEILDLKIEEGTIKVKTSKAKTIKFISSTRWGEMCMAKEGEGINCAQYQMKPNERYVRVEVIDESGKTAWSNPFHKD